MSRSASIHRYLSKHLTDEKFDESKLADPEPTETPRGSQERVEVYRRRLEMGERLFSRFDTDDGAFVRVEHRLSRPIVTVHRRKRSFS